MPEVSTVAPALTLGGATSRNISIVIPTLGREEVLLQTIESLLNLEAAADELLVADQTASHEPGTAAMLSRLEEKGRIRWLRLGRPSIPASMNEGLRQARGDVVLFLDDDIVPQEGLVVAHRKAHEEDSVAAVVGMVLQPGEEPVVGSSAAPPGEGLLRDLEFCFRSTEKADVWNVMAGNFSVKRTAALACGGFDERFVGVAYRFETEFCRRLRRHGGRVSYEPGAVIRHLKASSGGTRTWGHHQTSARPEHSAGDYYFALLEGSGVEVAAYATRRFRQETLSRFHLTHPWYIPVKALGEIRGFLMAVGLSLEKGRNG